MSNSSTPAITVMSDNRRPRLGISTILIVLGLGVLLWFWKETRARSLLQSVQKENASLREALSARDATIADLRARVERLEGTFPSRSTERPPLNAENRELGGRLAELTILQSKTLALVEKLLPQERQTGSPEEIQRQRYERIQWVESQLAEQQRKVESANQKVEEFLTSLNVPDDVAALEIDKALDLPSLKKYWPYFEARREKDSVRRLAVILRMRVDAEKSDQ